AAVAADHGLILVQPLTPAEDLTWWTELAPNTAWLAALHREHLSGLTSAGGGTTWWTGYSGGAEMITYGLLPRAGEVVTGGAVMVGGGGAPDDPGTQVTVTEARRADLPLTWATGVHDDGSDPRSTFDALSASVEGAEFYRARGFGSVRTDFSRDADHFTIDQVNVLHNALSGRL
ncbi:MAG: hypothetical protein GXX79_20180, partial [Actinomycetales bacterium]|nr:hypothetical protein [Actinomycetales bacterium]